MLCGRVLEILNEIERKINRGSECLADLRHLDDIVHIPMNSFELDFLSEKGLLNLNIISKSEMQERIEMPLECRDILVRGYYKYKNKKTPKKFLRNPSVSLVYLTRNLYGSFTIPWSPEENLEKLRFLKSYVRTNQDEYVSLNLTIRAFCFKEVLEQTSFSHISGLIHYSKVTNNFNEDPFVFNHLKHAGTRKGKHRIPDSILNTKFDTILSKWDDMGYNHYLYSIGKSAEKLGVPAEEMIEVFFELKKRLKSYKKTTFGIKDEEGYELDDINWREGQVDYFRNFRNHRSFSLVKTLIKIKKCKDTSGGFRIVYYPDSTTHPFFRTPDKSSRIDYVTLKGHYPQFLKNKSSYKDLLSSMSDDEIRNSSLSPNIHHNGISRHHRHHNRVVGEYSDMITDSEDSKSSSFFSGPIGHLKILPIKVKKK